MLFHVRSQEVPSVVGLHTIIALVLSIFEFEITKPYLSSSCLLSWSFWLPSEVNRMSQCLHLKGFIKVWILSCTLRLPFSENALLQVLQWNSFWCPTVCLVFVWIRSLFFLVKDLSQDSHGKSLLLSDAVEAVLNLAVFSSSSSSSSNLWLPELNRFVPLTIEVLTIRIFELGISEKRKESKQKFITYSCSK